jgi:hypothetical protein
MSSKICLVTCIYEPEELHPNIPKPTIRDALMERYINSITSMGRFSNFFFVIYCSLKNYDLIKGLLDANFLSGRYMLLTQEIEEFSAYSLYNAHKKFFSPPVDSRRQENYFSMVLSKPNMVLNALNLVDCENFFWVDAGLANEAFFPVRYREGKLIPAMGNRFEENLLGICEGTDLFFVCNSLYSFWPWFYSDSIFKSPASDSYNVIGGIWGGKKSALKEFSSSYPVYLNDAFSVAALNPGKVNFTEETIFSGMLRDFVFQDFLKVRVDYFSCWVHEDDVYSTGFNAEDEGLVFFYQVLIDEKNFDRDGLMFLRDRKRLS